MLRTRIMCYAALCSQYIPTHAYSYQWPLCADSRSLGSEFQRPLTGKLTYKLDESAVISDPTETLIPLLNLSRSEHFFRVQRTRYGSSYRLNARSRTPLATKPMPVQSRIDGRSPRNITANTATNTRLNLSIGATFDASPSWRARK